MNIDEKYIKRCIELSKHGYGHVEPNPYVGAVIVNDNKIIGEGFHIKYGGPHAEVNAINSVKDKEILKSSTIYVNLEPCSHQGKTPPCANLIIESGIKKVVISMLDPNKLVSGNGVSMLKNAGVDVKTGVLENESKWLNRRFITFHTKQRPYIILKWAKTIDGFIDIDRRNNSTEDNWITGNELKMLTHRWRTQEQGILIGHNTLINDNPKLNVREWVGKDPVKILITKEIPNEEKFNIFKSGNKTIVFNQHKSFESNYAEYIKVDFDENMIESILNELYKKNLISIIVEGGKKTLEMFIKKGFWDEARILTGNKHFIRGLDSPKLENETKIYEQKINNDILQIFKNKYL